MMLIVKKQQIIECLSDDRAITSSMDGSRIAF